MKFQVLRDFIAPSDQAFEVVERKGRGHPDTLADRLAETLSREYSKMTINRFGVVLRHQFDKLSLMGGRCDVRFGGGQFRSPIRLLINGRVSSRVGDEPVEFHDLLRNSARSFLETELRNFAFESDCRILWETTSTPTRGMIGDPSRTSAIHHRFSPRTLADLPETARPISNDTALGCAWAPYSDLEKLVLRIECALTSDEIRAKFLWMGSDAKIMAFRMNRAIALTVSIPQVSTYVRSAAEYLENLQLVRGIILGVIRDCTQFDEIELTLNPGDNTDSDMLYLRFTGSCIESGDEGQVSRGNRLGGVIASRRPFSIEGLSGKNPSYHAGKVYSAAAWDIANSIWKTLEVPCEVFIVSQIDRALDDPWTVIINTMHGADVDKLETISSDILSNLKLVTSGLIDGHYPLV